MNKKNLQLKSYAFTLVELIFVAIIIALIMPEMFSLYNFIVKSNKEIIARQQAIQQGYEFFERLNILMEDYTVDYEEYYNRQMVGCVGTGFNGKYSDGFERNVGLYGYCTNFTAYGNENGNLVGTGAKYHDIYYCSSKKANSASLGDSRVIYPLKNCGVIAGSNPFMNDHRQSYGQYAALFKDVKGAGENGIIIGSDDDKELGDLAFHIGQSNKVDAIQKANNIQELYLISHDGTRRLYFRRKLVKPDDNTPDADRKYQQYKIQMLRLRGFDAGRMHNFSISPNNKGVYDGVIDTRACDYSMGFEGHGNSIDVIGGAYENYRLPKDEDDCRLDLTQGATSVFAWNISISPRGDSDLYWAKKDHQNNDYMNQINAYMKIMIINKIYFPGIFGSNKMISSTVKDFSIPLETTINMKDFYRN